MAETLPVVEEINLITDTDNILDFTVEDENGAYVDPTGYTVDLVIAKTEKSAALLTVSANVVTDPQDGAKKVLRVVITDTDLAPTPLVPGSPDRPRVYWYSLKRLDAGNEKALRYGDCNVFRVRA